jgi:hypothetical protein
MNEDTQLLRVLLEKKCLYISLIYVYNLHTHFLCGIPRTSQKGITRCLLEVALFFLGSAIIYMMLSFEPAFAEQDWDTISATPSDWK